MAKSDQRLETILDATTELMSKYGFYGTSLERIGDKVGISKQNLIYYIKNKKNLMMLLIEKRYDDTPEYNDFLSDHDPDITPGAAPATLPAYYRMLARVNGQRPEFVQLFSMLNVEALESSHPAHAYFTQRNQWAIDKMARIRWRVPAGIDWREKMITANAMMDGIQIYWLRDQSHSLTELWTKCEESLFPLPQWDGYR